MKQKVVLLILDGFRWDYVQRDASRLPGFLSFFQDGAQAESLIPVYPIESCPNWTTISTGVYTEKHGVIGNYMFNKFEEDAVKARFMIQDQDSTGNTQWWEQGPEPIWITAMKHGRKTYTRNWTRSDAPFKGYELEAASGYPPPPPAEFDLQNIFADTIDRLLNGYDFVIVHYDNTNNVGHRYGPDSEEMYAEVLHVDHDLSGFMKTLKTTGLDDHVNVLVISDHGMTPAGETTGTTYLNLKAFVNEEDVQMSVGCITISITYKNRSKDEEKTKQESRN